MEEQTLLQKVGDIASSTVSKITGAPSLAINAGINAFENIPVVGNAAADILYNDGLLGTADVIKNMVIKPWLEIGAEIGNNPLSIVNPVIVGLEASARHAMQGSVSAKAVQQVGAYWNDNFFKESFGLDVRGDFETTPNQELVAQTVALIGSFATFRRPVGSITSKVRNTDMAVSLYGKATGKTKTVAFAEDIATGILADSFIVNENTETLSTTLVDIGGIWDNNITRGLAIYEGMSDAERRYRQAAEGAVFGSLVNISVDVIKSLRTLSNARKAAVEVGDESKIQTIDSTIVDTLSRSATAATDAVTGGFIKFQRVFNSNILRGYNYDGVAATIYVNNVDKTVLNDLISNTQPNNLISALTESGARVTIHSGENVAGDVLTGLDDFTNLNILADQGDIGAISKLREISKNPSGRFNINKNPYYAAYMEAKESNLLAYPDTLEIGQMGITKDEFWEMNSNAYGHLDDYMQYAVKAFARNEQDLTKLSQRIDQLNLPEDKQLYVKTVLNQTMLAENIDGVVDYVSRQADEALADSGMLAARGNVTVDRVANLNIIDNIVNDPDIDDAISLANKIVGKMKRQSDANAIYASTIRNQLKRISHFNSNDSLLHGIRRMINSDLRAFMSDKQNADLLADYLVKTEISAIMNNRWFVRSVRGGKEATNNQRINNAIRNVLRKVDDFKHLPEDTKNWIIRLKRMSPDELNTYIDNGILDKDIGEQRIRLFAKTAIDSEIDPNYSAGPSQRRVRTEYEKQQAKMLNQLKYVLSNTNLQTGDVTIGSPEYLLFDKLANMSKADWQHYMERPDLWDNILSLIKQHMSELSNRNISSGRTEQSKLRFSMLLNRIFSEINTTNLISSPMSSVAQIVGGSSLYGTQSVGNIATALVDGAMSFLPESIQTFMYGVPRLGIGKKGFAELGIQLKKMQIMVQTLFRNIKSIPSVLRDLPDEIAVRSKLNLANGTYGDNALGKANAWMRAFEDYLQTLNIDTGITSLSLERNITPMTTWQSIRRIDTQNSPMLAKYIAFAENIMSEAGKANYPIARMIVDGVGLLASTARATTFGALTTADAVIKNPTYKANVYEYVKRLTDMYPDVNTFGKNADELTDMAYDYATKKHLTFDNLDEFRLLMTAHNAGMVQAKELTLTRELPEVWRNIALNSNPAASFILRLLFPVQQFAYNAGAWAIKSSPFGWAKLLWDFPRYRQALQSLDPTIVGKEIADRKADMARVMGGSTVIALGALAHFSGMTREFVNKDALYTGIAPANAGDLRIEIEGVDYWVDMNKLSPVAIPWVMGACISEAIQRAKENGTGDDEIRIFMHTMSVGLADSFVSIFWSRDAETIAGALAGDEQAISDLPEMGVGWGSRFVPKGGLLRFLSNDDAMRKVISDEGIIPMLAGTINRFTAVIAGESDYNIVRRDIFGKPMERRSGILGIQKDMSSKIDVLMYNLGMSPKPNVSFANYYDFGASLPQDRAKLTQRAQSDIRELIEHMQLEEFLSEKVVPLLVDEYGYLRVPKRKAEEVIGNVINKFYKAANVMYFTEYSKAKNATVMTGDDVLNIMNQDKDVASYKVMGNVVNMEEIKAKLPRLMGEINE